MKASILKFVNSFDFFKALVASCMLSLTLFVGFRAGQYPLAMCVVVGIMLAYFANIEGTNRNRVWGMIASLSLGLGVLFLFFLTATWLPVLRVLVLAIVIFLVSMLSVFGFRGSMVGFAGMFAVVMGFVLDKYSLSIDLALAYAAFGGGAYIVVSALSQWLFQKKHTQLLLADCVAMTADYLQKNEILRWKKGKQAALNLPFQMLKLQTSLNENHEMLRSILMSERSQLISSEESRKLYLLFTEMVDIFEMAIAANPDLDHFEEEMGEHLSLLEPVEKAFQLIIEQLRGLHLALLHSGNFYLEGSISHYLARAEANIGQYVARVQLPEAREGALMMRNLIDLVQKHYEKLQLLDRTYNKLLEENQILPKKNIAFITKSNFSFHTYRVNFNSDSVIFRHSARLTFAFLMSFFIGQWLNPDYANWIMVTTMVILRPNYGLTKSRAKNRMMGTGLGMLFAFLVVSQISNRQVMGVLAGLSLLFGFAHIQKNYRNASAGITASLLLLYVLNENDSVEVILNRGLFTGIGVLVSLFVMYFVWPVWEKESIHIGIKNAVEANLCYLQAVNEKYRTKQPLDTAYRLVRKEAFLKNGYLNGAFQRMQEEPKSKKHKLHTYYAMVLLNHSLLSAIASYSAYIQGHVTTQASVYFENIMAYILAVLEATVTQLDATKEKVMIPDLTHTDFAELERKYIALNILRNQELEVGSVSLSTEMRSKLQEGRTMIEHLKWLKNLAENGKLTAETLAK
jgi:uncharacterized membrane protein YccC